VSWAHAAQQPLCRLTPNMHKHYVIDRVFVTANAKPTLPLETKFSLVFSST